MISVIILLVLIGLTALSLVGLFFIDNSVLANISPRLIKIKQRIFSSRVKISWSIGIYAGVSPFKLFSPQTLSNPVLTATDVTDLDASLVAQPFMQVTDSTYYLFFTVKDKIEERGRIGLAESANGLEWNYRQIVIDEPYDITYPLIFRWEDEYYMIPETYTEKSVKLFRATDYPTQWTFVKDLISGDSFHSPSLFRHKDMWWMFTARPGNETLRLFYTADLRGQWSEHPQSPLIENDPSRARPGGRPFMLDGKLYRIGQDCFPTYGRQVHAFHITDINTATYAEQKIDIPLVKASSRGWNAEAMHHVDLHLLDEGTWISPVDGQGYL